MDANFPFSSQLFGDLLPKFVDTHFINEAHSSRHTILPHTHKNLLELYFICSGTNHYMVSNRFYKLKKGELVICNADTLHYVGIAPGRFRKSLKEMAEP